jgi:metal-responsive CopG/Arc/MetJ family transcriptional regulator
MHVHVPSTGEGLLTRTTIEMKPEHRAKLLELAAHRGTKGFSELVSEALEAYLRAEADREAQRKRAVLLKGAMPSPEAKSLREAAEVLRRSWR